MIRTYLMLVFAGLALAACTTTDADRACARYDVEIVERQQTICRGGSCFSQDVPMELRHCVEWEAIGATAAANNVARAPTAEDNN